MTTTTPAHLRTVDLVEKIKQEFNVAIDARTVAAWVSREHDPLPTAFLARRGQSHLFDWEHAREWLRRELDRPLGENLQAMSMFEAKTISARARAKMDTIELAVLEGRYGEITAMEQMAEDCARQAVNRLMALPSRLAPVLARMTDELEIDRLLDAEIRQVCRELEQAAVAPLGEDPLEDPAPDADR